MKQCKYFDHKMNKHNNKPKMCARLEYNINEGKISARNSCLTNCWVSTSGAPVVFRLCSVQIVALSSHWLSREHVVWCVTSVTASGANGARRLFFLHPCSWKNVWIVTLYRNAVVTSGVPLVWSLTSFCSPCFLFSRGWCRLRGKIHSEMRLTMAK